MIQKSHFTIEFVAPDGEIDIKHILATEDEIVTMIDNMNKMGVKTVAHRIEPPAMQPELSDNQRSFI
jgi:hypothetical protein